MKKIILLFSIFLVVISCSNNDEGDILPEPNSFTRVSMTYSDDISDVSILIFGKENDDFIYQRTLDNGWVGNIISTNLELGQYKFLFSKVPAQSTIFSGFEGKKLEEIQIIAKEDPARDGYLLGVDEIWMPETAEIANKIYPITGNTNQHIKNTLTRSVSQVEIYVKRGEKNENVEGGYKSNIYENGDITKHIDGVEVTINGVGEYLDYNGSHGSSMTYYTAKTPTSINPDDGFAFFRGPFVFPTETPGTDATVDIIVKGKGGYPSEMPITVNGILERNRKLVITLWLSPLSASGSINITVDIEDMTNNDEGDKGIWE